MLSLFESSAEVASSKINILGLCISTRAIEILCLWPPLRVEPLYPITVSNPEGNSF